MQMNNNTIYETYTYQHRSVESRAELVTPQRAAV